MIARATAILWVVGAPLVFATILLNVSFYRTGSLTPDIATGRTYEVHEHGTLYVVPLWGRMADVLFFAGLALWGLAVASYLWPRFKALMRQGPPPS